MSHCSPDTAQTPEATPADPNGSWLTAWIIAGAVGLILVSMGWIFSGRPLAEKTAIALSMPIGTIWLVATGRVVQLLVQGKLGRGKMLLLLWAILSLGGTSPFPGTLLLWMEALDVSYDPRSDGPLDVVVVLGGGTSQGPWRAQAASAGDRLVMAAELYHAGHAHQLLTTGEATPGVSRNLIAPADQTIEIWTNLGIPREAILSIGGRNTSEELAELKKLWPELKGKRVGLLTSALHLPRALRLARAQHLDVIPIRANVKAIIEPWGLLDFVPQASNFSELAGMQHEIMAFFLQR